MCPSATSLLQRMKNAVRRFYWNQTYNGRVSAQCILVLRLHSAQTLTSVPAFYRQKEWRWQDGRNLWQTMETIWCIWNAKQCICKILQILIKCGNWQSHSYAQRNSDFHTCSQEALMLWYQTIQIMWHVCIHLWCESIPGEWEWVHGLAADSIPCHIDRIRIDKEVNWHNHKFTVTH
jgi:hypothetical protein